MHKRFAFAGLTIYVLLSAFFLLLFPPRLDLPLLLGLAPGLVVFIGLAIWATRRDPHA